ETVEILGAYRVAGEGGRVAFGEDLSGGRGRSEVLEAHRPVFPAVALGAAKREEGTAQRELGGGGRVGQAGIGQRRSGRAHGVAHPFAQRGQRGDFVGAAGQG